MAKLPGRDLKTGRFLPKNKAALRSGTDAFMRTGRIPKEIRGAAKLRMDLKRIKGELERMIGQENLSVKRELLIDQVISSTGFLRLFELYIKKAGLLDPLAAKKRLIAFQPGFTTYLSFMSKQKEALQSLDLDHRRSEKILSPLELARELDAEKAESYEG